MGNNGYYSEMFEISRSIRQGCPLSALLFILVAEILAISIRETKKIKGIKFQTYEFKITQLSDDTTLFLQDLRSVSESISLFNDFTNISGLRLNLEKTEIWDSLLSDYWDKQLSLLIRFGFTLDYDRSGTLNSYNENHTSAKAYSEDIQAYLDEEVQYNAILGPFQDPPTTDLHYLPVLTRDKPNAVHCRVIVDLSFPMGNSVNSGIAKEKYLGTPFILKLPIIDTITDQVRALGRGCMLYKIDISCAFTHIKLDPIDYDLLGLRHEHHYVHTCLPFRYRNGSTIFNV